LEKKIIQQMVENRNIVIACGGGGIPVMLEDGEIKRNILTIIIFQTVFLHGNNLNIMGII
jgi:carbamate kinase